MAVPQVQKIRRALEKVEKDFKFKNMSGLKVTFFIQFEIVTNVTVPLS